MNTFTLKSIALLLMLIDHIGLYFDTMPVWLRFLGRGSYPLFLFCMVWGCHYTRSRKMYLLRLYLMSIFMAVFGYAADYCFPTETGYGNHNIFVPMLLTGILISTIEAFCRDRKKGCRMLAGIFAIQLIYYILPSFFPFLRSLSGDTLTGFIPNLSINEYGFEFIVLGVLLYFVKERKDLLCVVYVLFCIRQFSLDLLEMGFLNQCFMIIALPFMLRYNKQRGPGMKYFFYFFYPAHTFLLFYIANYITATR